MKLRITIEGTSYDVDVEVLDGEAPAGAPPAPAASPAAPRQAAPARPAPPPIAPAPAPASGGGNAVKAPIAGTVTQVKVNPGDTVTVNQVVLVMEAMKMETNIASPVAGRVARVNCRAGDSVKPGQLLVEFE